MKTKLLSILLLSSALFKSIDAMEKEGFNYKRSELTEALYKARKSNIDYIKKNINVIYEKIIKNSLMSFDTYISQKDQNFIFDYIINPSVEFKISNKNQLGSKGIEIGYDIQNTNDLNDLLFIIKKQLCDYQAEEDDSEKIINGYSELDLIKALNKARKFNIENIKKNIDIMYAKIIIDADLSNIKVLEEEKFFIENNIINPSREFQFKPVSSEKPSEVIWCIRNRQDVFDILVHIKKQLCNYQSEQ
jgi:cellobiose-specific phosphotransferase system component IIA